MISARGLSFCCDDLLDDLHDGRAARTVMVFAVLLNGIAGCTAMLGRRMSELSSCVSSVTSACDT